MSSVSYLQYKYKISYEEAKRRHEESEPIPIKVFERVKKSKCMPLRYIVKQIKQRD